MKNLLLTLGIVLAITACTPEPKAKSKPSYVTIEKTDSKEMKEFKTSLSEYTEATVNSDVEKLVSFIYPKAFTIISKEIMLKKLKKAYLSKSIPMVENVKHLKITPIEKYDAGTYSIITSSMTTLLKSPKPDNADFESYMLEMLQGKLATRGTVRLDKEKHIFNIQHTNKTIALKEKGGWKFIGFKQAKKYIQKEIFPKSLIHKLQ